MAFAPEPQVGVLVARIAALGASSAAAVAAFAFFLKIGAVGGYNPLDLLRAGFMLVATFWLAWGAAQALLGLTRSRCPSPEDSHEVAGLQPSARIVVLVPIYEEDPAATFSRIAAMDASLAATGHGPQFHFAILSDTRTPEMAARERHWYLRLIADRAGEGRIFYRRRDQNIGRKAGNIEDFIQTSGAAYDFAIILDADSLMEGATMVEMARRMQNDEQLGLLQSLPLVINARSRFGRIMQFSAAFNSPIFASGLARMQGRTGPFWGHNAIVRIRAFAQSCGLPEIAGKPPFGGPILSHDYVEAALLARAGWTVRLDEDLTGSFEEGPETIIDHAKRDRRWCQGNLQYIRLLTAHGLSPWSRFVFVQGILAYLASLLWLGFMVASIAAPAVEPPVDFFPVPYWPVPTIYSPQTALAIGLIVGIFGLLILPKIMIGADALVQGRVRSFGGVLRSTSSTLAEILFSSVTAPILLMYQVRSVGQVLLGADGGWPVQDRVGARLTLTQAWAASYWIVATGILGLALVMTVSPEMTLWLIPVTIPMILAPLIIAWSARPGSRWLFATPQELSPSLVIKERAAILNVWTWQDRPSGSAQVPAIGQVTNG